jgi:hypothetical protein
MTKKLFVIQTEKYGRWLPTLWTSGPVQRRAAEKALARAQDWNERHAGVFDGTIVPEIEFRIREVKAKESA